MSKIVYFPSMNLPNNDWLKTSLLFYDKIGIITPESYINDGNINLRSEDRFEELTKSLQSNKHVELVESFYENDLNIQFEKEIDRMFQNIEQNLDQYKLELELGLKAKFFIGKLTGEIVHRFQHLGLLEVHTLPNQYEPDCFYLPKSIGQALMYKIAKKIGESDGYIPSTDRLVYTFNIQKNKNPLLNQHSYEEILLKEIFPIPEETELEELIEFKAVNEKELINYRIFIENLLDQLELVRKRELKNFLVLKKEQISREIKRLVTAYKDHGLDKITYKDFVNAGKIVSGPFGFYSAAINGILNQISRNKIPEKNNPLSYAALFNYHFVESTE